MVAGGDAVAAVERGWVVIIGPRDHRARLLAAGSAPAFSPDGRWIAFVAPDGRLMVIPTRGGHARAVGHIRAVSVDWQPKPRGPNPGCAAPPGSTVMTSTPSAIVTEDGVLPPPAFGIGPAIACVGCLRANGRERLLDRFADENYDSAVWVKSAVLAGPYTALIEHSEDEHYGGMSDVVQVFDLRTGARRKDLGGENAGCPPPGDSEGVCSSLDRVVLSSDGVSAAHSFGVAPDGSLSTPLAGDSCAPATELCVAVTEFGGL